MDNSALYIDTKRAYAQPLFSKKIGGLGYILILNEHMHSQTGQCHRLEGLYIDTKRAYAQLTGDEYVSLLSYILILNEHMHSRCPRYNQYHEGYILILNEHMHSFVSQRKLPTLLYIDTKRAYAQLRRKPSKAVCSYILILNEHMHS